MQFIKGHFKGNYKGLEVDPLRLRTIDSLHFLNVEPGATISNCEWIHDFRNDTIKNYSIQVAEIAYSDLHFNQILYPLQLPYQENLYSCVLIDPKIYSVFRKGKYTFGLIEAELLGIIGNPIIQSKVIKPKPEKIIKKVWPAAIEVPLNIEQPPAPFVPEKISTWSWGGCLPAFLGIISFSWLFWWLLHHHGCSAIPKKSGNNIPMSDTTITVAREPDSFYIQHGNTIFSVYDWNVEDHDTISMYLNDILIKDNLELNKRVYSWEENSLKRGDNILIIKSVNDGTVGPASPTIEINDGKNNLIVKTGVFKGSPKRFHLVVN
ncbi:MAG TPA: hypothetical protein VK498_06290 [Ferruginibacter sp.]|nr:hypothetical protein [Ferruginibacter sp.]